MSALLPWNPSRPRYLRGAIFALVAAVAITILPPVQEAAAGKSGPPADPWRGFAIETLSSAPDQVSGGDVLVRIHVPGKRPLERLRVFRNEEDVTDAFTPEPGRHSLVGLVDGLGGPVRGGIARHPSAFSAAPAMK